jgi:serine/threonine protein kinase
MALECGVNHRDAHTNNFLIDDKGRLKLIDFGIAKTLTEKEKEVVPLIPFIATDDCEELRDALEDLYKKDAWFLREPFSIDSYTTKVAKEAVRGSTGLREIIPQVDTRKRRSEVEKIRMDTKAQKTTVREPTRKEGDEGLQRLEREANWPTKHKEGYEERLQRLEREDAEGTTEQDRRWARELEEERRVKRRSRAIRILLRDHRQDIKHMSDEELEDLIEEAMSELRKDEEEDASGGMRKTKRTRKKRTRRRKRI